MKTSNVIIAVLILVIGGGLGYVAYRDTRPGMLDGFAACLADRGAVFYGAFWCPHCQAQKKMFGNSAQRLPYVECSTPDAQDQLQSCIDKQITNYPTWEFKDGTREVGEVPLETLAAKTGCTLTQQ